MAGDGAPASGSAQGGDAGACPARVPTWKQRAVVAIYVYFIPVFLALNALLALNPWTMLPWLA